MFQKKQMLDNIYRISKLNNIKIGDLEKSVHLSQGYFSRLKSKGEAASIPGVDVIYSVASILGVSIDEIVQYNDELMTPNEKRVLELIKKLLNETINYTQEWRIEKNHDGETSAFDDESVYPLFEKEMIAKESSGDYPDYFFEYRYKSMFNNFVYISTLDGQIFKTNITNCGEIYLAKVKDECIFDNEITYSYELYLSYNGETTPLYKTTNEKEKMANTLLAQLYRTISESLTHVQLSQSAKLAIDNYLNDVDINDELPF